MPFTVSYTQSAADEFAALPRRVKHQVRAAVARLARAPRGAEDADWLKGDWEGYWRLRIGAHRVIYRIENRAERVIIVRVDHRRRVYGGGPRSLTEP